MHPGGGQVLPVQNGPGQLKRQRSLFYMYFMAFFSLFVVKKTEGMEHYEKNQDYLHPWPLYG